MVEILGNPLFTDAANRRQVFLGLAGRAVERLVDTVPWRDMSDDQRRMCIIYTVSQVETQKELERRLESDFGITDASIDWYDPGDDKTGLEAQMFVKALGGLVAKSGALVSIMTFDGMF